MQRINPGDNSIQAATWNKFADTTKAFIQAPPQTNIKGSRGAGALRVLVQNTTGADITADFPILNIGKPVFTTADRPEIIYDAIQLQGTTPDVSTLIDNIAIVQGPIPDTQLRPAVIQGPTYCQIYWSDSHHTCAQPTPGNNAVLQSATTGVTVLWRETPASYPAVVWAIVDLGKTTSSTNVGDVPIIFVQNLSGTVLKNRSIVALTNPLIVPSGAQPDASLLPFQPVFQTALPARGQPFAITLQPANTNDVVEALTVGVIAVQVNYTDIAHQYARVMGGNYTSLQSATEGPAQIIWRANQNLSGNSALGVQWALCHINQQTPKYPTTRMVNASQQSLASRSVVGLTGRPNGIPPSALDRDMVLNSVAPKKGQPFAVTFDAFVTPGDILEVAPLGVVACQVYINDLGHTRAEAIDNNYQYLNSSSSGQAAILWRATSFTGLQWCVIRIEGGGGSGAISFGIVDNGSPINAATGTYLTDVTPGYGAVRIYTFGKNGGATAGRPAATTICENYMFQTVADHKPVFVYERAPGIFVIIAEGCQAVPGSGG